MSKFEPCPGATSDHAWRSIAVDFLDKSGKSSLHVQGATWNMQAQCESLEANKRRSQGRPGWVAHGNNPLDIDETNREYSARKAEQRQELQRIMASGHDFVFLQEPDWLRRPYEEPHFRALLAQQGWDMVVTPGNAYQKLVTFYNRHVLTPVPGSEQGHFSNSYQKFRGFQVDFVHNATQQEISLVNLHLEYGKDYRSEMLNLQKQMVQQNKPCIMGGDTNNVQNMQLTTMLGDWHAATCVESDGQGGLTTRHQSTSGQPIQKTYDGFFVNPGLNTQARITDRGGMCFKDTGTGRVEYQRYTPTDHIHHMSEFGQPWQRRKAIQSTVALESVPQPVVPAPRPPSVVIKSVPTQQFPLHTTNKNSGLALALLASSVVICALSIAALVMLPGPVGVGCGVAGLLVSAGMFGAGLHLLHGDQSKPPSSLLSPQFNVA